MSIYFRYEIIVLSKVLHGRLPITDDIHIVAHKIHVDVIDGGAIYILVLVITFAFVVEELHALVKVEFLALIANAHKAFVCLISVELTTGRNMHQQDSVLMTFRICTW